MLLSADYSQVELRILAHVADEPVLKEIFIRGEDVHTATASQVFQVAAAELDAGDALEGEDDQLRDRLRAVSDYGLADRLNIPREEAKAFIDAYLERFSRVAAFMAQTIEQAKEQGYVTTLFGRRRQIPELRARNYQVRSLGERLAVNTVIQGTAADVMKLAMIGAAPRAGRRAACATRLILTIHDELLFEGPPEEIGRGRARSPSARWSRRGATASRRSAVDVGRRARPGWRRSRMDRTTAVVLAAIARRPDRGAGADQRACSAGRSGTCQAALLSFLIGTRRARRGRRRWPGAACGQVADARGLPWWAFLGGRLGAVYVCTVARGVRTLGAGGVTAATIAGPADDVGRRSTASGCSASTKRRSPPAKLAGIALLAVGVVLVVRD